MRRWYQRGYSDDAARLIPHNLAPRPPCPYAWWRLLARLFWSYGAEASRQARFLRIVDIIDGHFNDSEEQDR